MTGALLVTVAAVGTFAAGTAHDGGARRMVVIARRDVVEGRPLTIDDLTVAETADPFAAHSSFERAEEVVGRTAVGPISAGDVIQLSAVTTDRPSGRREVTLRLPIAQVAIGRLRAGERVDVFATDEDGTRAIVLASEVLEVLPGRDGSLVDEREVGLVVAVESMEDVIELVHASRLGELTIVRATAAADEPEVER